jgi:hypothetical protein
MYVHKVKKERKKHTTLITNHGHVTRYFLIGENKFPFIMLMG